MTNKEGGLLMKERTIELTDCRARTSLAMTHGWWISKLKTMRAFEEKEE